MPVVWIFLTADSALLGADDTVLCKPKKKKFYTSKQTLQHYSRLVYNSGLC